MNKQVLPTIYSTAFWCLFVVLPFFFFFSFIAKLLLLLSQNEVKAGHFNLSGSWTSRNKNDVFFFHRNSNPLQIFQLQPKKETSSSSLGDRREKKSTISPSNRAICAGLRGTSRFRPVPVTTVCCAYQLICI